MLGHKFLGSVKDIFAKLLIMPTGGVDTTKANTEGTSFLKDILLCLAFVDWHTFLRRG